MLPRWIFLRALGLIYFSAFYSLVFQIRGLIGPHGILPAGEYLQLIARSFEGRIRFWYAPSLLWISSSSQMLLASVLGRHDRLAAAGAECLAASHAGCQLCLLSVLRRRGWRFLRLSIGRDASGSRIPLAVFLPPGLRPGLGRANPPSRFSLFLLQWEWFRIYFESGIVKLASGDPQWRNFTAMDEYYQNGPLPTWIGWYVQHLPHWFHAGTVGATLLMELGLVWMICLPRRFRYVLFFIVTLLGGGRYPYRELCISELPGARARHSTGG